MTDINTLIAEMRAGLEGVTPGPWTWGAQYVATKKMGLDFYTPVASAPSGHAEQYGSQWDADAAHIARCSPSNIAALLDEIERLRAANAELQGIDATLQLALERAQRERDDALREHTDMMW